MSGEEQRQVAVETLGAQLAEMGIEGATGQLQLLTEAVGRTLKQLAAEEERVEKEGFDPAALGPVEEVCQSIGVSAMTVCAVSVAFDRKVPRMGSYEAFCTGFVTALNTIAIQSESAV
jgi:hypothetical protein